DLNWLDWRVLFYGLGRGLLWLVVISSCWSMYGYFRAFYGSLRENLGRENLGADDGGADRGTRGVQVNLMSDER
ncbi:MAG TPA: hypothetical protein VI479_02940, partial [Blastocatellia bacterium]